MILLKEIYSFVGYNIVTNIYGIPLFYFKWSTAFSLIEMEVSEFVFPFKLSITNKMYANGTKNKILINKEVNYMWNKWVHSI